MTPRSLTGVMGVARRHRARRNTGSPARRGVATLVPSTGREPRWASEGRVLLELEQEGKAMLNPVAFASSLAVLTGAFYLLLYLLAFVWREAGRFLSMRSSSCRCGFAAPAKSRGLRLRGHAPRDHCLRMAVRVRVGVVVQSAQATNVEGQIVVHTVPWRR
jgi:hypothetical protein